MPLAVGIHADAYNKPAVAALPVAGALGWYDASDATTFTYSSGTVVSQWRDKSGNARHFAQGTVSLQPNRNGTQNGLPTIVFDGTDDYLDTAAFTVAQPITVFMAMTMAATANQGWFSSVAGSLQCYANSTAAFLYAGTASINTAGSLISGTHVWTFVINGAASSIWRDRVSVITGNPGTAGTTTGFRLAERNLAAGYRLTGPVFEVVVYPALSGADKTTVENYLKSKWGTP